jgi:hypothetical protein
MAVGAAAVLSDASNAFDIINDIQQYRPTVVFGIPSFMQASSPYMTLLP